MSGDSMYLTPREMREMTGYKMFKRQVEWLDTNGWVYILTPDAKNPGRMRPQVAREYWLQRMGVKSAPVVKPEPEWKPDFSDLRNGTATI